MVLADVAAKYAPIESWFYDTFMADGVLESTSGVIDEIVAGCGSVLEVGCGGGQLARRLVEHHPGLRVTGVDLAAEQVERATKRANSLPADRRDRLDFQTASALELPFRDSSFDAAVSIGSIKHWPDQARGLREMVRVLKDGGLIVVAELDRGGRPDDIRALARTFKFTALLRPLYLLLVRTSAARSLDLDDGRTAIANLPLVDSAATRLSGRPFIALKGTKSSMLVS